MLLELLSMSHTADDLRARNALLDRNATLGAALAQTNRSTFLGRFQRDQRGQNEVHTDPGSVHHAGSPTSVIQPTTVASLAEPDATATVGTADCLAA
jgi:hypothetical protein